MTYIKNKTDGARFWTVTFTNCPNPISGLLSYPITGRALVVACSANEALQKFLSVERREGYESSVTSIGLDILDEVIA